MVLIREKAGDYLVELWKELMNNANNEAMGRVDTVIEAFMAIGVLDADQGTAWKATIRTCPRDHGGGRNWCAYCGDIDDEGNVKKASTKMSQS